MGYILWLESFVKRHHPFGQEAQLCLVMGLMECLDLSGTGFVWQGQPQLPLTEEITTTPIAKALPFVADTYAHHSSEGEDD